MDALSIMKYLMRLVDPSFAELLERCAVGIL